MNTYSGMLLQAKLCVDENIPVIPIPGPSALVAALSASGLATDEFTFGNFFPFLHVGLMPDMLVFMYGHAPLNRHC